MHGIKESLLRIIFLRTIVVLHWRRLAHPHCIHVFLHSTSQERLDMHLSYSLPATAKSICDQDKNYTSLIWWPPIFTPVHVNSKDAKLKRGELRQGNVMILKCVSHILVTWAYHHVREQFMFSTVNSAKIYWCLCSRKVKCKSYYGIFASGSYRWASLIFPLISLLIKSCAWFCDLWSVEWQILRTNRWPHKYALLMKGT